MPKRLRESTPQDWGWEEYLGAWYSDGKFQSSVASYNVPRSYRSVGGHRHDAGCARGGTRKQQYDNDLEFAQHMWASDSWIDRRMGDGVYWLGDWFHTPYTDERPVKRLRGGFEPEDEQAADNEQSPLRNWQEEAEVARVWGARGGGMADGSTVERGTQGEVGLIPFKKAAYIQPTYTTASFKWNAHNNFTSPKVKPWNAMNTEEKEENKGLFKYMYRVNSPLDPMYKVSGAGGQNNRSCNGWNEYRRRYKWYRLVKNRVKVTILSQSTANQTFGGNANLDDQQLAAGYRDEYRGRGETPWAMGISLNPGNRYPYGSNNVANWQQLAQSKFTNWSFEYPGKGVKIFSFDYEPGAWDAIVAEQQKETFWTKTNEAPPLFETFMVWLQSVHGMGLAQWSITVEMDFTCQFREWTDTVVSRMLLFDTKTEDYQEDDPNMATNVDNFPDMGP